MKPDLELSKSFYYSGMLEETDGDEDDECEDYGDMPMSSKEAEQQIAFILFSKKHIFGI